MRETHLTLPELALVALTRGAAGFGLGLLLSDRFPASERKALGWGLFILGAATTIPLAAEIFGKSSMSRSQSAPGENVERNFIAAGA